MVGESFGRVRRVFASGHAAPLLIILLAPGCTRQDSGAMSLAAEIPLHLEQHLDVANVAGSGMPEGVPSPVEWRFDEPQPDWKPVRTMNPNTRPAKVERTDDALRLVLDESNNNLTGRPVGGIAIDLPGWNAWNWSSIVVRARSSEALLRLGAGFNTISSEPDTTNASYPYYFGSASTVTVNDGTVQTYTLRVPRGATNTLDRLGIWLSAAEPATFEIVSISAIPTEAEFADAPAGVRPAEGGAVRDALTIAMVPSPPAIYVRAPGRIDYDVRVPESGRLDVALGVLRDDSPVEFGVRVTTEDGASVTLLTETWRMHEPWAQRSLDLSRFAGRNVKLTLEADAEREGTVALFGSPTLYTPGRLAVTIVDDATGAPTPARVLLTDANGRRTAFPQDAISVMFGPNDIALSHTHQRDGSFYAGGDFEVDLQPGTYRLTLSKGIEYIEQQHELDVEAGTEMSGSFRLERWIDMPARGWFSADDHIHLRRSPREDPLILQWIAAEDVHVGALLQMGDFWATYFAQYAWGRDGVYQVEDHFLTSGQEEPRTHEIGHTISLAADDFVRFQGEYYYYDRVFDRVHELGGLTGYAHKGIAAMGGPYGMTLDVLRNKVDFVEILQFGAMRVDAYYHYLDLGFKLTATAGSDFPFGRPLIGEPRFYTHVGDDFNFDTWRAALRAGHTFVSSGPMIDLRVNGAIPGDELDVTRGSTLSITARAFGHPGQVPLEDLEIVAHGRILERVTPADSGQSTEGLAVELEIPVEHGMWIAARSRAGPPATSDATAGEVVAHTTPVYVTVDGGGFHNPETAADYLDLSERYLDELEQEIGRPNDSLNRLAWRYREGIEARIAETREVIARLRREYGIAR